MRQNDNVLLKGPIHTTLLVLAWPVIASNLMQTSFNLIDMFWVGRLGPDSVAAVSMTFPIVFLMISVLAGFTVAGTTMIAQYIGANNHSEANKVAGQTLTFTVILTVIFTIIGILITPFLIGKIGVEPQVAELAIQYLQTYFLGLVFMSIFYVYQSLMRGAGDTRTPMKLAFFSIGLNIILDPILIFGWFGLPALGVTGAALATVIAKALGAAVALYLLFSGTTILKPKWQTMFPQKKLVKDIIIIGIPAALEQSTRALGLTFMMSTVAQLGTATLAAYGLGNRINAFVFLPSLGLAQATTAMVGQNLGAGLTDRAKKTGYISALMSMIILSLIGVFVYIFAEPIISLFVVDQSQEVISLGVEYLRIAAFAYGFIGVLNTINGAFRGAGQTLAAMSFSIISLWLIRVPLARALSLNLEWGATGIWWAVALSNIIGAILALAWYTFGKWKGHIVTKQETLEGNGY